MIICGKDFNERNVQNFVAETKKLNSLIYLQTKKDERYLNNDICRFIKAQENDYQQALSEITLGRKKAIGCGIFSLNS